MTDYEQFIQQINHKTGIDLSLYKEAQMKRRLTSLRDKRGHSSFRAYFSSLEKDAALLDEFLDRMTINVSEFYRNRTRFEVLERKVIPFLLKKKKSLKYGVRPAPRGRTLHTCYDFRQAYIAF